MERTIEELESIGRKHFVYNIEKLERELNALREELALYDDAETTIEKARLLSDLGEFHRGYVTNDSAIFILSDQMRFACQQNS